MSTLLIGAFLLSAVSNISFGQPSVIPLWENLKTPADAGEEFVEVRDKGTVNERRHISNIHNPELLVYLPEQEKANGTGVLICPGGGYGFVSIDSEGIEIAKWLNSLGIAGFVLKYRCADYRYPAPLEDAKQAMKIIRSKADEFHIKADRVGAIGFSAGGHLAASLGTGSDTFDGKDCRPDFMILVYPVISMKDGLTHGGSRDNLLGKNPSDELIEKTSNELHVTKDTPPTFLVHADNDGVAPSSNSVIFYTALKQASVRAELHIYEKGGHGFGMRAHTGQAAADWPGRCEIWLKQLDF